MIEELRILGRTIGILTNPELNNVYFTSITGAGHSGPTTVHHFRNAIGRSSDRYDEQFYDSPSELLEEMQMVGEDVHQQRTIIILDEYVGTGNSVIEDWGNVSTLTNDSDRYIYTALVGAENGIANIRTSAPNLEVVCGKEIKECDKIFHSDCNTFTQEEKIILRDYCEKADKWPTGYGDVQSLTVFYQRAPNNVIGILRGEKDGWIPLFPRFY